MEKIPTYVHLIFLSATIVTVIIFYWASKKNKMLLTVLLGWTVIQIGVALSGFFTVLNSMPPRLIALILPPVLGIIILFNTKQGKHFIDCFDIKLLTVLHTTRILIEVVLFYLFLNKVMPLLMTFEGRNFDILSGLSAPIIYYLGFVKKKFSTMSLLAWNIICLSILAFTVVNGVLSAPTPLQKFGFEQPNIAVLYFPYILLPGLIVPIVYFSHLVSIRQLISKMRENKRDTILLNELSTV